MRRSTAAAIILSSLSYACESNPIIPTAPTPAPSVPVSPAPAPPVVQPRGLVTITIDDGWRSTYINAFPILDAAGLKTTNYIITGRFNATGYIGPQEVLSLQARGHEIGAHSRSHLDLAPMTQVQLQSEVAGSRTDLLNIGVQSVTTFAYPFGIYTPGIVQVVREAGFASARATDGGLNMPTGDRFTLKRQSVGGAVTLAHVQSWVDSAVENRAWLILLVHHVDTTIGDFSITPQLFQEIVTYLVNKQVRVVTMAQGLQMVP